MTPLHCRLTLPQPSGGPRVVELEIPQKSGDEGMRVFEKFCRRYGPPELRDAAFEAILAADRARREDPPKRARKPKP